MTKELKGNIDFKSKENNLGIRSDTKYVTKTYRITRNAAETVERMAVKYSEEARINIPMSKLLEIIIFYAETKSLSQLMDHSSS